MAVSAFALLPFAIVMLQLRVFYAMKDSRTPTLIQVIIVAVKVPLLLGCPLFLPPNQVVLGLAAANGVSFVVGAVVGQVWLHRRLGALDTGRVLIDHRKGDAGRLRGRAGRSRSGGLARPRPTRRDAGGARTPGWCSRSAGWSAARCA